MEQAVIEQLKMDKWVESKKKEGLWYKETNNGMQFIDLRTWSCYAYKDGKGKEADIRTHSTISLLKALNDPKQMRL